MPSPGLTARMVRSRRSLERLKKLAQTPWETYRRDEDLQALAERHLQILLESVLDLAAFIASRLGISSGTTYRDLAEAMIKNDIIPEEYDELMLSIPGMRNILVHGYAEIRHDIIYDTLVHDLKNIETILGILWHKAEELDP